MLYRGVGLLFFILLFSGCAYMEGPRWDLLGDTNEEAFFIDRQDVQRLPEGNYLYPVKTYLYLKDQPHKKDESHDTNKVLFVEMNCRQKLWTKRGGGVVDRDNKVLFKHINPFPAPKPVESGTIHFAAYNYLCNHSDIIVQHNH